MMRTQRSVFVCGGQGKGLHGLGIEVLAQTRLLQRAEAFSAAVGRDIPALLRGNVDATDTLSVHLALVSAALLSYAAETTPFDLLAGHSLGELSALACAGALSDIDAMRLAAVRGQAMAAVCAAGEGGMVALMGRPVAEIAQEVQVFLDDNAGSSLWIANINTPEQLVVSGKKQALDRCARHMTQQGLHVVPLATAGAFHSPLMAEAAEKVFAFASRLEWRVPHTVCLSGMTGEALSGTAFAAHCALQILSPVRWVRVMETMRRAAVTTLVEVGSNGMLGGFCTAFPDWNVQTRPALVHRATEHTIPSTAQ